MPQIKIGYRIFYYHRFYGKTHSELWLFQALYINFNQIILFKIDQIKKISRNFPIITNRKTPPLDHISKALPHTLTRTLKNPKTALGEAEEPTQTIATRNSHIRLLFASRP